MRVEKLRGGEKITGRPGEGRGIGGCAVLTWKEEGKKEKGGRGVWNGTSQYGAKIPFQKATMHPGTRKTSPEKGPH